MDQPVAGSSREVLGTLAELVRAFPSDRWDLAPGERVELAMAAVALVSQVQGLAAMLLAEADSHNAAMRAAGTPCDTLLASKTNLSRRQAAGMMWDARRLDAHPLARQAVLAGEITMSHGQAVGKALEQMPAHFTPAQVGQAEAMLLKVAAHATPDDVIREASRADARVDPVDAERLEVERLSRLREAAWRNRCLTWRKDEGSVWFKGSLPLLEDEALTVLVDAFANQAKRQDEDADHKDEATLAQRRADALAAIVAAAQTGGPAPALAGDRPVIMATLDMHKLQDGAADAGVLPDGRVLAHADLRRLCCDAGIIPVVLGGPSEPLDVGRTQRFVTPAIRKALHLRDGHCAFPHCQHLAHLCDAHHVRSWLDGGPTALNNLVLLCPTHHGLVEPDRYAQRDQWVVTINPDGRPHFQPPRRYQQTIGATGPPG